MRLQTKEAQEFRLQQICALREEGFEQKEIARLTGCTQGWVSRVLGRAASIGVENLKAKPPVAGNKPALGKEELADLSRVLDSEARASGFSTDGWTRKQVARVIFRTLWCAASSIAYFAHFGENRFYAPETTDQRLSKR